MTNKLKKNTTKCFYKFSILLFCVSVFFFSFSATVLAQIPSSIPNENTWVTDGRVNAIVPSPDGNTIYIGGNFNYVGPNTGSGVPIDIITGQNQAAFPRVNGDIYAVVSDGSDGWYIGGEFTQVGGVVRNRLAHILPDGRLGSWDPNANGTVRALAVSGSIIYVGGDFTRIGVETRNRLAAINAGAGLATAWNPNVGDGIVLALAISGSTLYVGGDFTTIGEETRNNLAAITTEDGSVITDWNLDARGGIVRALAVSGSIIYVGGDFTTIGVEPNGVARNRLAAIDAGTGSLITAWNPNADRDVHALAISDDGLILYVGGDFTRIGVDDRNNLAAITTEDGSVITDWAPDADGAVHALAVRGSTLYVGGNFTTIGGDDRNNLAALNISDGLATDWDPNAGDGDVHALAVSDEIIYVGGEFTTIGGVVRNNLAAIDTDTGSATDWDPNVDGGVLALAISGEIIYVGGEFTTIGGVVRNNLAAITTEDGSVITDWDPNISNDEEEEEDAIVRALAISDDGLILYVGGSFTTIGEQPRNNLAAITTDEYDGSAIITDWDPNVDGGVLALAISGEIIYVGGEFITIGGVARNNLAAITTGEYDLAIITGWDPNVDDEDIYTDDTVRALAISDDGLILYVGGYFITIGEELNEVTRNRLAAIDAGTGLATAWNPNADGGDVRALAISGSTVYVGGSFTRIGGKLQSRFAQFNPPDTTPPATGGGGGGGGGGGVGLPSPQSVTVPVGRSGSVNISQSLGGQIIQRFEQGNLAKVEFPIQAIEGTIVLKTEPQDKEEVTKTFPLPLDTRIIGDLVVYFKALSGGKEIEKFEKLVPITFTYSDGQVKEAGADEKTLKIYWWDRATKSWKALESTVNTITNTVTAYTIHFTLFAVIGETREKPIVEMTVEELKAKIAEISAKIAQLKARLQQLLAKEVLEIPTNYKFTVNLKYGQKGDDVRHLQMFLKAQGPEIYPEGIVSGWFDLLTKRAVIRFQEKYVEDILAPWGLTKGTGFVGKTTRAKINEILGR